MRSTSDEIKTLLVQIAGNECYRDEAPKTAQGRHIVWQLMPPRSMYGDDRRQETVTRAVVHVYDFGAETWTDRIMNAMENAYMTPEIVLIESDHNTTHTVIEVEAV